MSSHANISWPQCLFFLVQKLKLLTVGLGVLGCTFWLFCWIVWKSARNCSTATAVPRRLPSPARPWATASPYAPWPGTWEPFDNDSLWHGPWRGRDPSQGMRDGAGTSPQSSLAGLASPCSWPRDPWCSVGAAISHREPGSFLGTYFAVWFVSSRLCECKWKWLSRVWPFQPHGLYSPWNSPGQNMEWVAFPFPRGSSQSRDGNQVSHIAGGFFTSWATREAWLCEKQIQLCAATSQILSPAQQMAVFLLHGSISQLPTFLPRSLLTCLWLNRKQVVGD